MVTDDREIETLLSQYRNLVSTQFDFDAWVNKGHEVDE